MLACPWKRTALSIRATVGVLEGGSFTWKFERQMRKDSGNGPSLSMGARGNWRKGSNIEKSERHVMEDSGNGAFLQGSITGT